MDMIAEDKAIEAGIYNSGNKGTAIDSHWEYKYWHISYCWFCGGARRWRVGLAE